MFGNLYNKLIKASKPSGSSRSGDELDVPTIMASGLAPAARVTVKEWKPGDVIMERYKVESVLSGAMGRVYICDHLGWGIKMAIKSPRPEVLADHEGMQRIIKEANGWIRMGMHPNIAACYYVLAVGKIPHLFIEYVDGGSLAEWIKAGRCRDLRTALSLAVQFCHGMEYTHGQGIIHRDIKPANILVTKNALLKITDFGILLKTADRDGNKKAAPLPADVANEGNTVGFRGTPGFASPEQFANTHNVDHRTDIFSFGLCLWLMLCGKKPFAKNNVKQAIPEPVSAVAGQSLSPTLIKVLKKSVAFAVDDRYQDFVELRQDLNQAYLETFRVMCPYAELTNIDLRASSLNNHAVSFFELNKVEKAEECLSRALDINDVLPEALYNMMLLKWRRRKGSPVHLLRQLEAIKKRLPKEKLFDNLVAGVKDDVVTGGNKRIAEGNYPEFRLCVPRRSLEVFRDGQLIQSIQRNIVDHLDNKRYDACQEVLQTAWKNHSYCRDKVFNRVYEALLKVREQEKLVSVQRLMTLRGGKRPVTCLTHIPGSKYVVAGGPEGKLQVWDFITRQKVNTLGTKGVPIRSLAASPAGGVLGIGADNGFVTIWSTKTGKVKMSDQRHAGPARALAFSKDGKWLASGGEDGMLMLRHLSTGKETKIAVADSGAVCSLAFCGDGNDLVTGSEDGTVRLWEGGGKEYLHRIEAHALPVISLSVSVDGRRFASTSADRLVKVWDRHSCRSQRIIEAHEEGISSVLLLADNRYVVSGCDDDMIKLWDVESGSCPAVLDGRGDGICSLAAGPKAHIFMAGRRDGALVFWMNIYQLAKL
ncbi:MAG: serine/threonine protein kinase [Desulfobulbaceae bacterium]|nr:serine/threonine protein kinase [Desulfobulbaceae bacterium]